MISLNLSSTKTLASLSEDLKPLAASSGAPYFSTDRAGAEKIAVCFRENQSCHAQLEKESSAPDWLIMGLMVLVGGIAGYTIGVSK